jgi:hypothetical protein
LLADSFHPDDGGGTFFRKILHAVLESLLTASVVPSSLIVFTLMIEAIRPSETSVLTRDTWRKIPEDGIFLNLTFCCLAYTYSQTEERHGVDDVRDWSDIFCDDSSWYTRGSKHDESMWEERSGDE